MVLTRVNSPWNGTPSSFVAEAAIWDLRLWTEPADLRIISV
jgi:hypothetical protein